MRKFKPIIIVILLIIISIIGYLLYQDYRIKHAKIKVELVDNLDIEVYSKIKLKDLIKNINGKLIKNRIVKTDKLGKQEISFKYINEEKIKVKYKFKINIVDTTKPYITGPSNITLYKGSTKKIEDKFFCGDNYDDKLLCEVIGDYNINEEGTYNLIFQGTDNSDNQTTLNFRLNIIDNNTNNYSSNNINNNENTNPETITYFTDIKNNYKTKKTKIGIDVSKWQGDIDYKKVKEAGIEFVYLRMGIQQKKKGQYYLDSKFERNIKGFTKEKVPIGVYFYSKADSPKEARKQAKWVIKQIKKYKTKLPIVFDWENWSEFKDYNLSFYKLTNLYYEFEKEINKHGYEAMLYSSKYYLENIWYETNNVWLAHYTNQTNYQGKYKLWQMCDDGVIDGIDSKRVDIDIMYK